MKSGVKLYSRFSKKNGKDFIELNVSAKGNRIVPVEFGSLVRTLSTGVVQHVVDVTGLGVVLFMLKKVNRDGGWRAKLGKFHGCVGMGACRRLWEAAGGACCCVCSESLHTSRKQQE